MSGKASHRAHGRPLPDGLAPFTTLVELTFEKRRVEHWIRFGRKVYEQILDRRRSVVGFAPESKDWGFDAHAPHRLLAEAGNLLRVTMAVCLISRQMAFCLE